MVEKAGYEILIIDSLSHAWVGREGALEMVDKAASRTRGNSFAAWRHVTPLHNQLVDAMLGTSCHLIATLRSKMDYVQERDEQLDGERRRRRRERRRQRQLQQRRQQHSSPEQ